MALTEPGAAPTRMAALAGAAPWLWLGGSALVFAGERWAASEPLHYLLVGVGYLLALVVLALAVAGRGRSAGTTGMLLYGLAALGLALHRLTASGLLFRPGQADDAAVDWRSAATVAWLLCWWLGTVAAVAGDWTRLRGGDAEPRRVHASLAAALSLALAVAWVVALNYTAAVHDRAWEWSERSRARASEATLDLVGALRSPVEVIAFFPPANPVLRRIEPFLDEVTAAGPVTVTVLDHALAPARAADLGARENGVLFLLRGGDQRRIDLDVDHGLARRRLGALDRDFQEALLELGRERRTLYLTAGHGERGEFADDDGGPGLGAVHEILRVLNVATRSLPVADLIQGLPPDASVVAVLGPTRRFLPEETDSLRRFWQRGGSILLLLEPDVDHGLGPLLGDMAARQLPGTVANDRYHLRRDGGVGDRRLLVTNRFGSHATVRDLARAASRIGLVLEGAGGLEGVVGGPARASVLVRPMTGSWLELDGDFEPGGEAETGEIEALAMASTLQVGVSSGAAEAGGSDVEGAESRAVVIADVDAMSDDHVYVTGPGAMSANAKLLLDAWSWLAREGEIAPSSVPGDDDPVLRRTRGESIRWFLGSVFGAPLLVLGIGIVHVRRRRASGRGRAEGEAAP